MPERDPKRPTEEPSRQRSSLFSRARHAIGFLARGLTNLAVVLFVVALFGMFVNQSTAFLNSAFGSHLRVFDLSNFSFSFTELSKTVGDAHACDDRTHPVLALVEYRSPTVSMNAVDVIVRVRNDSAYSNRPLDIAAELTSPNLTIAPHNRLELTGTWLDFKWLVSSKEPGGKTLNLQLSDCVAFVDADTFNAARQTSSGGAVEKQFEIRFVDPSKPWLIRLWDSYGVLNSALGVTGVVGGVGLFMRLRRWYTRRQARRLGAPPRVP